MKISDLYDLIPPTTETYNSDYRSLVIYEILGANLCLVVDGLINLWKAAEECDNASRHVGTCEYMNELRGCSCGHDELAAALKRLEDTNIS
jgi:hypothetical protein